MTVGIKKLAEQSGFYFYDMHDIDGEDCGESIEADSLDAAEKFAEAIIHECILATEGIIDHTECFNEEKYRQARQKIKWHFGIE